MQSRSMPNPPLSDIDLKNEMAWVWTTLNFIFLDFWTKWWIPWIISSMDSLDFESIGHGEMIYFCLSLNFIECENFEK